MSIIKNLICSNINDAKFSHAGDVMLWMFASAAVKIVWGLKDDVYSNSRLLHKEYKRHICTMRNILR